MPAVFWQLQCWVLLCPVPLTLLPHLLESVHFPLLFVSRRITFSFEFFLLNAFLCLLQAEASFPGTGAASEVGFPQHSSSSRPFPIALVSSGARGLIPGEERQK